jgi:hypothetical protein
MSLEISKAFCYACSKQVYPQEKLSADDKIFHKGCFRCKHCNVRGRLKTIFIKIYPGSSKIRELRCDGWNILL